MSAHPPLQAWARHLAGTPAGVRPLPRTALTVAEAARVQRYRDQLLAALQAQDRVALHSAKQQVLNAAFGPGAAPGTGGSAESPALRWALRDLSWRMAAALLVRGMQR